MTGPLAGILTRPHLVRHPAQSLAIFAGVALAVAGYAAMHLANSAIKEAFWAATDHIAGNAQLQILTGDAGVPEQALDQANTLDCVQSAAAVLLRVVSTGLKGEAPLAVVGVDLLEEPRFRDYRMDNRPAMDDALVFLAQPDSVLLTREFALRNRLERGADLLVWTGEERRRLRVRGLIDSTGVVRAYGGNVALMDVFAAQHIFGRRGFFDRIDIRVREGAAVDECRKSIQAAVGPDVRVEPPASRGKTVEAFSDTYTLLVESTGLLGALVAMFLVNQASAIAVAQREKEIGILLGLGADSTAIERLVMMESAVTGAVGAIAGIALGAAAAHLLSPLLATLMGDRLKVQLDLSFHLPDWRWALATAASTALLCVLAAWAPARRAAMTPPIQLAEAGRYSSLTEPSRPALAIAGMLCFPAALVWQFFDRRPAVLYLTLPAAAIGISAAGSLLARLAVIALRPLAVAVWPLEGRLATDTLLASLRRARGALLGLGVTAATVLAISSVTAGYAASFSRWTRLAINGDFLIHSANNIAGRGELLPYSLKAKLESTPGVASVIPVRRFFGTAGGHRAKLISTDIAAWSRHAGIGVTGDQGAVISRNFAIRYGLSRGDPLAVASPRGPFTLTVAAIIDDHASDVGTVYFDWALYRHRFGTEAVELFGVYRNPSAQQADVRAALAGALGSGTPAMLLDGDEFRAQLDTMIGHWRRITALQAAIAMALSLIAIAGFLAVSVNARRRELGVLSVLGATPGQIARCISAEAVTVAAAGLLLGLTLGLPLHAYLLFTLRHSVNGFALPWIFDVPTAATLALVFPAAALAAALPSALASSRANLATEIESDA